MNVHFYLLTCILLSSRMFSSQLELLEEDSQTGILISPFNRINIRIATQSLAYTFNISSVNYILTWQDNLKSMCIDRTDIATPVENEIKNIHWNISKPFNQRNFTSGKNLNVTLFHNELINAHVEALRNENGEVHECLHLYKIVQNFVLMNRILNEMAKLNTSVFKEIFSLDHLLLDVRSLLRGTFKNYSYPFDFSYSFSQEFFKYTTLSFYTYFDISNLIFIGMCNT